MYVVVLVFSRSVIFARICELCHATFHWYSFFNNQVLPHRQKNYPVRLCRRIKNRGFKIHMHNLNNDQTSIIWSHIIFNTLLSKTYRFRVIDDLLKVVGWQKVRFCQKVCKNSLIKKNKNRLSRKKYLFWIADCSDTVHFWGKLHFIW